MSISKLGIIPLQGKSYTNLNERLFALFLNLFQMRIFANPALRVIPLHYFEVHTAY